MGGQELDDVLSVLNSEEEGDLLTEDELVQLQHLILHPLDLNRVRRKELEEIPLVSSPDAALIISFRDRWGGFQAADEVRDIPGVSVLAARLLPLVTTVESMIPVHASLRNRWVAYDGDARILTQGEFEQVNLSGGFTVDRDPGEASLSDFVSGHLVARMDERTVVTVGDHQAITGYGLLFGPIARPFKTPTGLARLARLGKGLRPHRSTREQWALRGLAINRSGNKNRWWASLSSSQNEATDGERLAALAWERLAEPHAHYGILLAYDRWVLKESSALERPPRTYGSLFGKVTLDPVDFFGEVAAHTGTSPALLAGLVSVEKSIRWIVTFRHYPMGFRGPRSQPFREFSSEKLNETGLYQGISIRWGKHRLLTHGDIFRRSDNQPQSGGTSYGFETVVIWTLHLKNKQLSLRWKGEEKMMEDPVVFAGEKPSQPFRQESWRLYGMVNPNGLLRLQIQLDRTGVHQLAEGGPSSGYGLSARVRYKRGLTRLTWTWTGFRVEDSSSRIYLWDLNLPAELRIKSFSGRGQSLAMGMGLGTSTGALVSARIRSTWKRSPRGALWMKPRLEGAIQMDIAL